MALSNPLIVLALLFSLLGLLFIIITIFAIKKRRIFATAVNFLTMLLMLALSALLGTITIALRGYRELTKEEIAAVVKVDPIGEQKFRARFSMPNGSDKNFFLSGDQLYVDAHILKWKPLANILGLHTAYELDRVAGRYALLNDETSKPHTVYSLSKDNRLNMFDLRRRFAMLSPFLDAEYGSATFINSISAQELKVMVSTTGLLIRKSDKKPIQ